MTIQMVASEASWSGPQQSKLQGERCKNESVPIYSSGASGQEGSQDKELEKERILNRVDEKVVLS